MYTPELIAPAGNFEKLKIAIQFGADAVYLGDSRYSLRACADNFAAEEIKSAAIYAHSNVKKIYITVNIFPHDAEFEELKDYIQILKTIPINGIVVSDPGVFTLVRKIAPDMDIHISTQANVVNSFTIKFWEKLGAKRVILARELSFDDIKKIRENTSLELEVFIHGAMCMSYSGRCMLSSYLVGRDANQGKCAHPCRYKYNLLEEKRPGQYFPVEEDKRGTYIFSAKDLCTIEHIYKFLQIGINGFKIEGRMKGIYYLAIVTKSYRQAIDAYLKNPQNYLFNPEWKEELANISHREYTSGFYFEKDKFHLQTTLPFSYIQKYDLVGIVKNKKNDKTYIIEIRNKISLNDEIEIFGAKEKFPLQKINKIIDIDGNILNEANPNQQVVLELPFNNIESGYLLRRKKII